MALLKGAEMSCKIDYVAPADLLAGRTILVTGAGDGIGRAAALAYARHGATLILLGRTLAKLEKVYDEIEAFGGPQPAIYPLNFEGATLKDYHDMAETLHKEFGCLDGILHNAGLLGKITPFEQYDPELWAQVMQRSEEHTSELQSRPHLVCRLLLEKKKLNNAT